MHTAVPSNSKTEIGSAGTDGAAWDRRALAVLLTVLAVRLAMVFASPLELSPDEAYYWDWSRQLDWGYYSKPPLIAWMYAASERLFGRAEWALRLPAALLSIAGLIPLHQLARRIYGSRVACCTLLLSGTTIGAAAAGFLMTIDAPMLCCWSVALWAVWELFESPQPRWRWWLVATVACGLGLLSKQTMAGFFPLAFAYLIFESDRRRALTSLKFWSWIAVSVACLAPVVFWNAQHDWITAQHTREHFGGAATPLFIRLMRSLEFQAGLWAIVTPVTFALACGVSAKALRHWTTLTRAERFLLWFSAIPMLGVLALSLVQRVQPNWPAPFLVAAIPLAAAGACRAGPTAIHMARGDAWLWRSTGCGLACSALLYAAIGLLPFTPLAGTGVDPMVRLRGWKSLAADVADVRNRLPDGRDALLICATSRTIVSPLAYYLSDAPRVYRWNPGRVVDSQHEIWPGPTVTNRRTAIIVTHAGCPVPPELAASCDALERVGEAKATRSAAKSLDYEIWVGTGMTSWPNPVPAVELANGGALPTMHRR